MSDANTLYTIGHSTRPLETFIALLNAHGVTSIADVRRFPGSRRHPHFASERLSEALTERGFGYRHFEDLGGRRGKRTEDSPNLGWRVEQFGAYADYMASDSFANALEALMAHAQEHCTAMMCAEAVPWRCHRRLVADALTVRGWTVIDILSETRATVHKLTPFAHVEGERVTYPAAATEPLPLAESD